MDRKQAIEFGESRKGLFGGKMEEYIKLSVEALKKQDKEQQPEDTISRQAVMETICTKHCTTYPYCKSKYGCAEMSDIKDLPSVQPKPKTGYISIDNVMSVFDDFMCGEVDEDGIDTFLEMLKDKAESEVQDADIN